MNTQPLRKRSGFPAGLLIVALMACMGSSLCAQPPVQTVQGQGQPRPGGFPPRPAPGPVPLPILPALPRDNDTAFYARADVPHGTVEQATYRNNAGHDKRMHVYLPEINVSHVWYVEPGAHEVPVWKNDDFYQCAQKLFQPAPR